MFFIRCLLPIRKKLDQKGTKVCPWGRWQESLSLQISYTASTGLALRDRLLTHATVVGGKHILVQCQYRDLLNYLSILYGQRSAPFCLACIDTSSRVDYEDTIGKNTDTGEKANGEGQRGSVRQIMMDTIYLRRSGYPYQALIRKGFHRARLSEAVA